MPKTLTGNSPQREQRIQSIMLNRIAFKYERRIAREIARAMHEGAVQYENGRPVDIQAKHARNLKRILDPLWRDSAKSMAEHIGSHEKAAPHFEKKEAVLPTVIANTVMQSWINTYGTLQITEISSTTQSQIGAIINRSIENGDSERETAKAVSSVAAIRGSNRAGTIARTETHSAANVSADATAKAAGVRMRRQWVSAENERTRKEHREADGQVVGMDEPFTVGGYSLQYPSDYRANAPARLTINCRCAVAYIL